MTIAPPIVRYPHQAPEGYRRGLIAKLGFDSLIASIVFWLTWGVLFAGTITYRFDNLILRRDLGGGYVLDFEFAGQEGIFVSRSSSVLAPLGIPTEQLLGLAVNPGCIAGEVGSGPSAPHKWFVIDKRSGAIDWFETKASMESKWVQASGGAAPVLSEPTSFRPIWGLLIIGGGVLAFLLAACLTVIGFVLLIVGNSRRIVSSRL